MVQFHNQFKILYYYFSLPHKKVGSRAQHGFATSFIYINNFFRQNNSLKVYQNTLIILKYYKFDNFYDLYKYEYYIFIFYNLIIRMEDLNPKYFH